MTSVTSVNLATFVWQLSIDILLEFKKFIISILVQLFVVLNKKTQVWEK